ncbi:hypothetical protein N657DRAFT_660741 [Parathielavia appendiculata]|uniref:Xylanolytic transcriptional activator regulatory domain-containing protein n=1 Tax=Parathielavia appendiculata TaxID=2587402 RepID=A0AAN6UD19_9PEZI|nr:hypothetical protein N657DRAFT_660741 [Parathielavia appendiculata]
MASSNTTGPLSCSERKRRKQKVKAPYGCGGPKPAQVPDRLAQKRGASHQCKFESKPVKPKAANDKHSHDEQPSVSRKRSFDGRDSEILPDDRDTDDNDSCSDLNVSSVLNGMGYMSHHHHLVLGQGHVSTVVEGTAEDDEQSDELKEVLPLVPEKRYTDCLVDNWLNGANHHYYALYPPGFRAQYAVWWATSPNKVTAELTSLILRVCACSLHFIIEDNVRARLEKELDTDILAFANRLHAAAEKLSASIPPGKGGLVHSAGKFTEAWHALSKAIQAAIEIGLHQDSLHGGMSDFDREMGRRVWVILYLWDFSLNSLMFRPRLINHADCTVVMPSQSLEPTPFGPDQPWQFRHMNLHCQLCMDMAPQLGGRLDSDADKADMANRMRNVVVTWFERLPAEYAVETPDTRWDGELKWVVFQRQYLHVIGYMSLSSQLRPFIMRSSAKPMSHLQLRLREAGVDAALGLMNASLTLFDNLVSFGHKSPCAILCLFNAATVMCAGFLQDEARTLPKREAVLEAMKRGLGMLAAAASESKETATLYRILKRLLAGLPLSAKEKGVIGASKRVKDERTTSPSDKVTVDISQSKCAIKSASTRTRRRQGSQPRSVSGSPDSASALGSSNCQPCSKRSAVSLPDSCRPLDAQAPSNGQAGPSPVVPLNGVVQVGGHPSCSTFVPSTPINPTYPGTTESLPATGSRSTTGFMASDGYPRSQAFVRTAGFQYTSTVGTVDAVPFMQSGWQSSWLAMNGLGNDVQTYQAVNLSGFDNAALETLRCWEIRSGSLGPDAPRSWGQSSAYVPDQGAVGYHPGLPGDFNGRIFEMNERGQSLSIDDPSERTDEGSFQRAIVSWLRSYCSSA